MKNILNQIFVTLGVIFLIIIVIAVYYWITDPYNLKPMIFGSSAPAKSQTQQTATSQTTSADADTTPTDTSVTATGGFKLSEAQKQALISFGIDPATVPSSISADQEACFVSVLGETRVSEIKTGAVPSALEFFRAKTCI